MSSFLYFLSVCLIPGILGACFGPSNRYIPAPCSVRNLTIFDSKGKMLANDAGCNNYVNISQLQEPLRINFSFYSFGKFNNSRFTLVVFDSTSKLLLWMVRNITTQNNQITPLLRTSRARTVQDYQAPINMSQPTQIIQFFVFEETYVSNFAQYNLLKSDVWQFDLTKWLEKEWSVGSTLCGPVAASQLTAIKGNQLSPQFPPNYGWTTPYTTPNNPNYIKQPSSSYQNSKPIKRNAATYLNSCSVIVYFASVSTLYYFYRW